MSGVTFMVDERGQKAAAVINLRKHERLWEDFHDALLVKSRSHEPRESLESVKRRFLKYYAGHIGHSRSASEEVFFDDSGAAAF